MNTHDRNALTGAFTLVELLVVVAIISLLLSILLPALNRARDIAKEVVCMTNARGLANAEIFYSFENASRLTPSSDYDTSEPHAPAGVLDMWQVNSKSYVNCWGDFLIWQDFLTAGGFACPSDDYPVSPAAEAGDRHRLSYGLNAYLYGPVGPSGWGGRRHASTFEGSAGPTGAYGPAMGRDVQRTSDAIMLVDTRGNQQGASPYGGAILGGVTNFGAQGLALHTGYSGTYAFFDGHSEKVTFTDMFGGTFDPTLNYFPSWGWMGVVDSNIKASGCSGSFPESEIGNYPSYRMWALWTD